MAQATHTNTRTMALARLAAAAGLLISALTISVWRAFDPAAMAADGRFLLAILLAATAVLLISQHVHEKPCDACNTDGGERTP